MPENKRTLEFVFHSYCDNCIFKDLKDRCRRYPPGLTGGEYPKAPGDGCGEHRSYGDERP